MEIHELKTWAEFFKAIQSGEKTFEIRNNDRNFQVGDMLLLREYDLETDRFTGRETIKQITYITDFLQNDGYGVMSIR